MDWMKAIRSITWADFLAETQPLNPLLGTTEAEQAAKIAAYKENTPGFSWLDDEAQAIFKQPTLSMTYGLPTLLTGNPEGNFFLCQLNPSTDLAAEEMTSGTLLAYKDVEKRDREIEDIAKYIFDPAQSLIAKEIAHYLHQADDSAAVADIFSKEKQAGAYYSRQYYKPLLENWLASQGLDSTNPADNEKILAAVDELAVCNVELAPYRERMFGRIHFQTGKSYADSTASKFALAVILWRINQHLACGTDKPVFIFKGYPNWEAAFEKFLATLVSPQLTRDTLETLEDYAYITSARRNTLVSENNVLSVKALRQVIEGQKQAGHQSAQELIAALTDDTRAEIKRATNFTEVSAAFAAKPQ